MAGGRPQPMLAPDTGADPSALSAVVDSPRTLPGDIADLAGRHDELVAITGAVRTAANTLVIVAIDGMGGIGKTTIALRAAHELAPEYPDGQLFLDLRGHTPGQEPIQSTEALGSLLRMIGVAGAGLP